MMANTRGSIARGLAVVVTVAFLGVLGYYLVQPGYTWTRLVSFAVLGGLAVSGTAGVFYHRELIAAGGACGLLLMSFSLATTLWMYILPVAAILVVSALLTTNSVQRNTPVPG